MVVKYNKMKYKKINILQGNIDRGKAAMDLLDKIAEEKKIDIFIIAEPNRKKIRQRNWVTDNNLDVAILVHSKDVKATKKGQGDGFVWIETGHFVIYGCYVSPNVDITTFEIFLQNLRKDIKKHTKEVIIGGDFNAKSHCWNSKVEDRRGILLAEWMAEQELVIHNRGDTPTFVRRSSTSYIDITFSTKNVADLIQNWSVLEEESLSYHRHILFQVLEERERLSPRANRGWRVKDSKLNEMSEEVGRQLLRKGNRNITLEEIISITRSACDKTFPKKKTYNNRQPTYWWNDEVATLRKNCLQSKRALVRVNKGKDEAKKHICHKVYAENRSLFKNAIIKAKTDAWRKVVAEVDSDIWGKGYKIVAKKVKALPQISMTEEEQCDVAKSLFPAHTRVKWLKQTTDEELNPFTEEELIDAASKIKTNKSPGPDGIPPEVVKVLIKDHTEELLGAVNRLVKAGLFPEQLKVAKLVLIEKGTKPNQERQSYRPICLLNTFGKMIEQLLLKRLKEEIDKSGGLAENQYGFREGRSTISALCAVKQIADKAATGPFKERQLCALVTVDVQNAFNSVTWGGVLAELSRRGVSSYLYNMIASYLEDRKLIVGERSELHITCGVPQGSVLGPTLWNLYYDDILKMPTLGGVSLVSYADDLAVVITGKRIEHIQVRANYTLRKIQEQLTKRNLEMAPHKSEAVLLAGGRTKKTIKINIGNMEINSKESIKYLGVHLHRNMKWSEHIRLTALKASKALSGVCRLMPKIGGPRENNRRILCSVAHSIMLYGAPIWGSAMDRKCYRNTFLRVQRQAAIRITRAYRTTSTKALLVLARVPPIHLLVDQRNQILNEQPRCESENNTLIDSWKKWWDIEDGVASWTKALIKDVGPWILRKHGETNFYLTQILTGHGAFNAYLHKFKVSDSAECIYCGLSDTAQHTFFECDRWRVDRIETEKDVGILTPGNLVNKMLENQQAWEKINQLATKILLTKDRETQQEKRGYMT